MRGSQVPDSRTDRPGASEVGHGPSGQRSGSGIEVALLTGGGDKPYALGLASALMSQGVFLDFIGSNEVNGPQLHENRQVNFLNLRGDQSPKASPLKKVLRVLAYYLRLIRYAAISRRRIFHILWNNKFELFDRTVLMLYYRLLGRRIVLTAHNVNAGKRDSNDTFANRLSLRIQYGLADHIFVHTERMKDELIDDFGVRENRTTVIPFGINNTIPETRLTSAQAKQALGVSSGQKTMLFFGNIAPYKGLEYLIGALREVAKKDDSYRLVIAGTIKNCKDYWDRLQQTVSGDGTQKRIIEKIEYIPDENVELYFKAADVLILPYTHIFQSGVLFLGYRFGLPVIATDVGSLREEIIEGKTGFVCRARDPVDLANAIDSYFASELFKNLETRRCDIRDYAVERYSWDKVGSMTATVYSELLGNGYGALQR